MDRLEGAQLNKERYFNEARSALQEPPSPRGWARICDAVTYGAHADHEYPETVARAFREAYLPHIEEGLSRWPDELRVVEEHSPEHVRQLGRIFSISFAMRTPTHEQIDALADSLPAGRFIGFRVENLRHDALRVMQRLCARLDPQRGLTQLHLQLEPYFGHRATPRGALDEAGIEAVMAWLFTTHHATIEVLGLDVTRQDSTAAMDAAWGALLEWAPRLEQLRELHIGRARSDSRDWGAAILDDPSFDRLTSLAEYDHRADRIDRALLMRRDASKNLNRLKMFALGGAAVEQLLDHPNLANVTTWDIRPGTHDASSHRGWGSEHAEHWAHVLAKRRGEPVSEVHPLLRQRQLVIEKMGARELHDIFFGDGEALAHSEWLEELELRTVTPELLDALASQGHEAFPNLKSLRFAYPIRLSSDDYERLGHAEIAPQLTTLSMEHVMFPDGFHDPKRREKHFDTIAPQWLTLVRDETLDTRVRYHAWETFLSRELDTLPFLKKRARLLGLRGYSSLDQKGLKRMLRRAIPEAIKPSGYYIG